MDEILTHILATGLSFAPIMMIITEGVKQTRLIATRYLPIVSLILGTGLGVAMGLLFNMDTTEKIPEDLLSSGICF